MDYRPNALTALTAKLPTSAGEEALCAQLASRVPAFVRAPTFVVGPGAAPVPTRSEVLRTRIAMARGLN